MNIDAHYTEQAKNHGDSPLSTMPEPLVRELETKVILDTMRSITRLSGWKGKTFLDYGCGNGYTLSLIGQEFPELSRYGYEPNGDMRQLASKHATMLPSLSKDQIDVLLCQRCLINLPGWNERPRYYASFMMPWCQAASSCSWNVGRVALQDST